MDALPAHLRLGLSAVAYVLAYGAGIALFVWAARRRGLANADVRAVAAAGLFGGLFGASALQLIAGGWLAVVLAKRSLGVRRPLGDAFAFAIAGGEAIGRFGCFFAGCCYGKVANVPWAVHDHGELRHPTQLYSALAAFATLAIIAVLERRRALPENGIFYVQGALFCALRFLVEFYRDVPAYAGFSLAQYACIAGFAFFAWKLRALLGVTLSLRQAQGKGESAS
jgi:phosphatidylglycerol:prolipoprotein diacylglycerol transferase